MPSTAATPFQTGYTQPANTDDQVSLPAGPEPLRINKHETAVVVVDMQNAYASPGGYIDVAGFSIDGARSAIAQTKAVVEAARAAGMTVVYFQNGWDADYVEAGTPGSPNWHKSNALKTMRARPELHGTLLAKGTWDYDIIEELKPQPGDILVPKTRYSGFFNTGVDSMLRSRGIRNLVFTGVATNVCVESSLRDAFHLEYFCVVLSDAVNHIGPDFIRQAALFNIEKFFGWVSTSAEFIETISGAGKAGAEETSLKNGGGLGGHD
ncbi:pyrimidine utilization protein B [Teratosphaeria destructans]|uniref:Pyrimidine utilization protein B n=1 Tax=Teratosphaeria destructans TaxID=418781 RepID=A0A9W7SUQ4_9PEZI|nr:pyrimidine utilization protein B [Teratosphaeria destructans]